MTMAVAAPPLAGMDLIYGQWITAVGEDGALLIAGHIEQRRAVAAMNRFSRRVIGLVNMADDRGCSFDDIAAEVRHRWALPLTVDDCEYRAEQLAEGRPHRCEMCQTIEGGDWWVRIVDAEQPGAFPVTWYEP